MKKTTRYKISLKVLYLEDSPHDAEIIRELLTDAGYNLSMDCVEKEKEYVSLLRKHTYDVILSDFTLPGFDAFGALQLAVDICPDVPFICVSGSIGEETASKLIKQGAVDYILKNRIARLPLAVQRALDEETEKKSRQRVEESLRESEEGYRLLLNSNMDGILFTSAAGEILSANPAACRMFNRSEEEICSLGRKCIVDESDPRLANALDERTKTGKFSGELTLLRSDGTKFPAEVSAVLFKDKKGIGRSSMVIRDITERNRAEEALRMSEAKLSNAVKMAHLAHWEYDVDSDLFTFNDHFYALFRTTVGEVGGYTMSSAQYAQRFVHPADKQIVDVETRKALETTDPHYSSQVEHKIIYTDGGTGYITVRTFIVKDDQGRTIKTYGVNQDITERKRAEDALRDKEQKLAEVNRMLQLVMDTIPVRIFWKDKNLVYLGCNRLFAEDAGRSAPAELIGDNDYNMGWHEQAESYRNDDMEIIRTGMAKLAYEEPQTTPDGKQIWLRTSKIPLLGIDNQIIGILGTYEDVTERKRVQEALRESSERLHLALESANAGVWEWNLLTNENTWSDELWKLYGLEINSCVPSYETWRQTIHPDDRENTEKKVLEAAHKGSELSVEWRVVDCDGAVRWLMSRGRPIQDANGKAVRVNGIVLDITERRRAEEAIRESEERFRMVFENVFDGICIYDVNPDPTKRKLIECNERYAVMAGRSREELLHLENTQTLMTTLEGTANINRLESLAKGTAYYGTFSWIRPDGKDNIIEYVGVPITWRGKLYSIGIDRDITEKRRAEEALHEREKLFRGLFNASPDAIVLIDPHDPTISWPILDCNEATCKMNGYAREELIGRSIDILNTIVAAPEERIAYLKNLRQEGVVHVEASHRHKDGHIFPVEVSTSIVAIGGQEMVLGIDRDITERKGAEEAVRETEERFRMVFENVFDGICIHDEDPDPTKRKLIECNERYAAMAGRSREELLRLGNMQELQITLEDRANIDRLESLAKGTAYHGTFSWIRPDGRDNIVEYVGVPITWRGKSYSIGIDRDITEQRQAEETLRQSEERYRLLYEYAPVGILLANGSGQILEVNPAALKILGSPSVEETKRINILTFPLLIESGISAAFQRCVEKGRPGFGEYPYVSKWGKPIYMYLRYVPVFDAHNQAPLMHIIIEDVTERKQAAEELRAKEENYRQLFDASPDGIILIGTDARIVRANIAMAQMYRYDSPDDLIGVYPPQFVAPSSRDYSEQIIRRRLNGEDIHPVEYELVRKDGTTFYGETLATILRNESGTVAGYICITRDITERKRAEETLQASEAQYRSLFENANEAIYIIEPFTEKILEANSRSWEMYGFAKEEFIGMSLRNLTRDVARGESAIRRTLETLSLKDFETVHTKKDGTLLNLLVNASVINYKEQRAILCISRDITERIQAEEKRQKLERDLFQAQRIESIGEMASGIAHDFNNILNIMLGNTSVLLQGDLEPQKVKKGLDTMTRSINRGIALVRQILTFARKTDVEYGVVDINASIKEIAQMVSETFPKSISLSLHLKDEIPSIILDGDQFHQAILNLCINARDAMPKGGVLRIATDIQSGSSLRSAYPEATEDSYVCVTVKDTGTGISPEIRRHIFEPFFTTKERGKGTGLGLAVVYGIVRSHNGFINLESEVGKGSTFFLYLPAKEVRQREVKPNESIGEEPLEGDETILVVEDEEDMLELLAEVLGTNGYRVFSAKDGEEAIRISRQNENRIDLVLCDVQLPKISGRETCRQIKQMNPDVKIVFASGFLDSAMKKELIEAGASDFVQKPCSPSFIIKTIRKVLTQA